MTDQNQYYSLDHSNYKNSTEAISFKELDNKLINIFGEHAGYIYKQNTNSYKVMLHIYQVKLELEPLLTLFASDPKIGHSFIWDHHTHTDSLLTDDRTVVGQALSFEINDITLVKSFIVESESLFMNIGSTLGPLSRCTIQNKDTSKSYDTLITTIHSQSQYPLNISQTIAMFVYGDFSLKCQANIRVFDDDTKTSKTYELDIFPNVFTAKDIFAILCAYNRIYIRHGNRRIPGWEHCSERSSEPEYKTIARWIFHYKSKQEGKWQKMDKDVYLKEMNIDFDNCFLMAKQEYHTYVQEW